MSDHTVINSVAEVEGWNVAYFMQLGPEISVGYRKHDVGLLIMKFAHDRQINAVSSFSKENPTGETLLAGDRLRYALRKLQGE